MENNYINTMNSYILQVVFYGYIGSLGILVILLILSLLLLILGCLIKSQSIKSRFIKLSLSSFFLLAFIISIPIIIQNFKNIV